MELLGTFPGKGLQYRNHVVEYNRVNGKLIAFEQRRGQALRDKLFEELRYYLDSYSAGLHCMGLKMMDSKTVSGIARRDLIGILMEELNRDFDLGDIGQTLAALDDAFLSLKENEFVVIREASAYSYPECNSVLCNCGYRKKIKGE
jgi:hypothetical protein